MGPARLRPLIIDYLRTTSNGWSRTRLLRAVTSFPIYLRPVRFVRCS